MRSLLLSLTFLLLFISSATAQDYYYKSTPEREKAIQLVRSLPEMIAKRKSFDKNHVRMAVYIDKIPTRNHPFYHVVVAEDQQWRLMNHYIFAVNSKTYAISYWAVIEEKFIPIDVWRKHHYKDY